jgi:hypothetical protein
MKVATGKTAILFQVLFLKALTLLMNGRAEVYHFTFLKAILVSIVALRISVLNLSFELL